MEYKVHSISSKSCLHKNNEDNYFISDDYVIIADGMGGECDGDIASRLAVDAIASVISEGSPEMSTESDIRKMLDNAIYRADSKILEYIENNPGSFGMGTTVLLTIKNGDCLYIAWCGDSHCYTFDKGRLNSLTKDHSYVQELIDSGEITVAQSYAHPDNNLITRYVGGGVESCNPDFCIHRPSASEIIIMCSDGLSGYCQLNDIEKVVSSNTDVSQLPKQLRDLAVSHGSDDDITIIVLVPQSDASIRHEDFFGWLKRVICK